MRPAVNGKAHILLQFNQVQARDFKEPTQLDEILVKQSSLNFINRKFT